MSKRYTTNFLVDTNGNTGGSGQVLISTSTGVNWSDGSDISGGPYLPLSAGSGFPLTGDLYMDKADPQIRLKAGAQDVAWLGDFGGGTDGQLVLFNSAGAITTAINGQANSYINGGSLGIGTASPTEKLEVIGNSYVRGQSIGQPTNYATSSGWATGAVSTFTSQPGYFGGNFNNIGATADNYTEYDIGPFGVRDIIWKTAPEVGSNDDGGWQKSISDIPGANSAYLSVSYVKRTSSTGVGTAYHGCDGGNTLNLDDTVNTNPYFMAIGISTLPLNVWCVSIGIIQANNDANTTTSALGGIYNMETGAKIASNTTFKMKSAATGQVHRIFLYYSSDTTSTIVLAKPGFYTIDGTEPSLSDLTGGAAGGDDVFWSANGNHIYNDNSGNVGIGTSSPLAKLDVNNDNGTSPHASPTGISVAAGVGGANLLARNGSYHNWFPYTDGKNYYSSEGHVFRNQSHGTTWMTLISNGNVGIGTTSPNAKLAIGNQFSKGTNPLTYAAPNTGVGQALFNSYYVSATDGSGAWPRYLDIAVTGSPDGTNGGSNIRFLTNPIALASPAVERMRINSSGITTFQNGVVIANTASFLKFTTDDGSTQTGKLYEDGTGFVLEGKTNNNLILRSKANTNGEGIKIQDTSSNNLVFIGAAGGMSGFVGIGENTPLVKLHISDDSASGENIALILDNNNNTAGSEIAMLFRSYVGNTNTDFQIAGVANGANDMSLSFRSDGGTERLRIDANGKIIVPGNGYISSNTADGSDNGSLQLSGGGAFGDTRGGCIALAGAENGNGGLIQLRAGQGTASQIRMYTSGNEIARFDDGDVSLYTVTSKIKGGTTAGRLVLANSATTTYITLGGSAWSDPNSILFVAGSSTAMLIKPSGNVGIGTTSPQAKLHVDGTAIFDTQTGANPFYITRNGNANESLKIYVDDAIAVFESIQDETGGAHGSFQFTMDGGSPTAYTAFYHGTGQKMKIEAGGNVGIGATSPSRKLQVEGSFYAIGAEIDYNDLLLKHSSNVYSPELKFQNDTHIMGMDYQNNETLRFITRTGGTTVPITFEMRAGTITAVNFILSSDERLKENIKELEPKKIEANWKSFNAKNNKESYRTGVIAQELEIKHPEFVETNDEGFKSVKYIDLLISKIAELEDRIKKLEE